MRGMEQRANELVFRCVCMCTFLIVPCKPCLLCSPSFCRPIPASPSIAIFLFPLTFSERSARARVSCKLGAVAAAAYVPGCLGSRNCAAFLFLQLLQTLPLRSLLCVLLLGAQTLAAKKGLCCAYCYCGRSNTGCKKRARNNRLHRLRTGCEALRFSRRLATLQLSCS
jgi:hypothetical protein